MTLAEGALAALCRALRAGVAVLASGERPALAAGPALRWLGHAGLVDRLGRPRSKLQALMDLARNGSGARGLFAAGRELSAEVRVEQLGRLWVVVVSARPAPRAPTGQPSREAQVTVRVADGFLDKEIAAALGISVSAVKKHVARARKRLGARNRAHLAALLRWG